MYKLCEHMVVVVVCCCPAAAVCACVCFCLRYLCPGRRFQSSPSPTAIRVSILNVTISPSIFDEAYFFFLTMQLSGLRFNIVKG